VATEGVNKCRYDQSAANVATDLWIAANGKSLRQRRFDVIDPATEQKMPRLRVPASMTPRPRLMPRSGVPGWAAKSRGVRGEILRKAMS